MYSVLLFSVGTCSFDPVKKELVWDVSLFFVNKFSTQVLIIVDVVAISVGRPSDAKVKPFSKESTLFLSYFKTRRAPSICQN